MYKQIDVDHDHPRRAWWAHLVTPRSRRCVLLSVVVGVVIVLLVILLLVLFLIPRGRDWGTPFTARAHVVVSDSGVCAQMGNAMMNKGGSAADGAIVTVLCLGQ
jgi:hypothetical protein